jgi:hypothetical protein
MRFAPSVRSHKTAQKFDVKSSVDKQPGAYNSPECFVTVQVPPFPRNQGGAQQRMSFDVAARALLWAAGATVRPFREMNAN